ncbi:MAG: helicase-related protein [Candidatus Woesearchaeota archaeon]
MVTLNKTKIVIGLVKDTIKINKQLLIFNNSKRGAEKTAEDIAKKLDDKNELIELHDLILNILQKPTKQCERLAFCIKKGVAFHHAGLVSKQRELIEENFRLGKIKVISSTPTLAMGLDLPAYRVILKDLKRFGNRGMQYIPILEYKQMIGRAGRPKFDKEGEAISIALSESEANEISNRFIFGEPEEILSKLAAEPALRTYILSLISSNFITSKKDIFNFFSKTFWAFQYGDLNKLNFIIDKMLKNLELWGLIQSNNNKDFLSATEFGVEEYKATLLGKRTAELYVDPYTSNHLVNCLNEVNEIDSFAFLQMISNTLEIRPQLNVKVSDMEMIEEILLQKSDNLLQKEPSQFDIEYEPFLCSIKTALFMQNWIEENDEEFLMEKYGIRPGEIRMKLETADWLLYTCEEILRIIRKHNLISEIRKLRVRLKYGVKEELLPLLRLKNIGRIRARLLYRNNIKDLGDIKKIEFNKLSNLIGKKIAEDIKSQVGIKINDNVDLNNYS